ncbi:MAG: DUF5710 domain-containing protein [Pseudomonadota bacterium]
MSQLPPFDQPFQAISIEFGKAMEEFEKGNSLGGSGAGLSASKSAARAPGAVTKDMESHFFLVVPFAEKDEAKRLGARWDAAAKKWYVPPDKERELFKRWLPGL